MRANLPIDSQRLWADVMALADITEPGRPYTRTVFTPKFMEGRDFLARRFAEAGLEVRIDPAGNLIGRRAGASPGKGVICIGSHSDTVPRGGRFDGAAGVIAALEVARSLAEQGHVLEHDLEVVDCLAEEANVYGVSCIGSRAISGRLTPEMLAYAEPGGESVAQAIKRVGGDADRISEARRDNIAAFLEIHIEQGRVLESEAIDVGIVHTIVGILRVELRIEGRADHAGTTPMHLRSDALGAAAEAILAIRRKAEELARAQTGYFAATVGVIEVDPNAANVIPASARLVIDARAQRREVMEHFSSWIEEALPSAVASAGARMARITVLSDSGHTLADPGLCRTLAQAAEALGFSSREMASGAGHDAAWFSRIAPMAMIFTPCREGRSHCSEEWVEPDQLAAGAAVMHEAILRFDRGESGLA